MQAFRGGRHRQAPDGLTDIAPGKIVAVATYLEMHAAPTAARVPPDGDGRFEPLGADLARYRALYAAVGAPWLWFSRAVMRDSQLLAIIADPAVEPLAYREAGTDLGMVELDFRQAGECELSFLGLVPGAIGRGLGKRLLGEAIGRAFRRPIRRLWLHTCTLDHPAAVAFYMAGGFVPYARAIEVADDPRLTGHLARDAAPRWPIV